MKWKDSFDNSQVNDEPGEDYLDEETYSPWKKRSAGGSLAKWFGKSTAPYIVAGTGVLILVIALWSVFSGSSGQSNGKQIRALDERIGQLEDRLGKLDGVFDSMSRVDVLDKKIEQLKGRFDRMEASLALRMDHISKRLDRLKSRTVASGPAKPAEKTLPKPIPKTPSKPAKKAPPKPPEKITARYHTVSAGETLYSISRQNGLTVAQLRRMNNLSPTQTIHPGQKLLVRPAKGQ